ncbi:hypothetical protein HDU92_006544 [Lobulomyces angularis]|nr:hypothetical protein HDU92_006544 [Lobulomyces angularis]
MTMRLQVWVEVCGGNVFQDPEKDMERDGLRNTLSPKLNVGDVVIWDRKAGRCKNPKKQHYNPEAMMLIESMGAKVLFFCHHKEGILIPSDAAKEKELELKRNVYQVVIESCDSVSQGNIAGYYRERAEERTIFNLYPNVL